MKFPDKPFSGFENLRDISVSIRGVKEKSNEDYQGLLYSPAECTLYLRDGQHYPCPFGNKLDFYEDLDMRVPTQVADALLDEIKMLPYNYDNFVLTDVGFKFYGSNCPSHDIYLFDLDKENPDRNLYENLKLCDHIELWEGDKDVTDSLRFTFFEIYEFLSKNFKK